MWESEYEDRQKLQTKTNLDLELGLEMELPICSLEDEDAAELRLWLRRLCNRRPHAEVRARVLLKVARHDTARHLVLLQAERAHLVKGAVVKEAHKAIDIAHPIRLHLLMGDDAKGARGCVVRDAVRGVLQRHCADLQLLDLVDGANGEDVLGDEREAVWKGRGVQGAHLRDLGEVDV